VCRFALDSSSVENFEKIRYLSNTKHRKCLEGGQNIVQSDIQDTIIRELLCTEYEHCLTEVSVLRRQFYLGVVTWLY
jgi:hypothetical protein